MCSSDLSQVDQVDLDEIGDEEAPCIALRNMSIGDVCPRESEKPPSAQDQPSSSMQASPPTQNEDEAQVDEEGDQSNEPPQDDGIDQGEEPQDMYNRLKTLVNQVRNLGSKKWDDHCHTRF